MESLEERVKVAACEAPVERERVLLELGLEGEDPLLELAEVAEWLGVSVPRSPVPR
jgi:hypothetical protein